MQGLIPISVVATTPDELVANAARNPYIVVELHHLLLAGVAHK